MKKPRSVIASILICFALVSCGGGVKDYSLNEDNFFLVMTNMLYFPEQYNGSKIDFNAFTYILTDIDGNEYPLAVRKCSSGYGCNCGKDTIIGFILEYDGDFPEPKNQSEDTVEKTWVHVEGEVKQGVKTDIKINSYDDKGEVVEGAYETVTFLTFVVEELSLVEDYQNLNYYVTK